MLAMAISNCSTTPAGMLPSAAMPTVPETQIRLPALVTWQ